MPQWTCGDHRTTTSRELSPSTMLILWIKSSCQVWWQAPFSLPVESLPSQAAAAAAISPSSSPYPPHSPFPSPPSLSSSPYSPNKGKHQIFSSVMKSHKRERTRLHKKKKLYSRKRISQATKRKLYTIHVLLMSIKCTTWKEWDQENRWSTSCCDNKIRWADSLTEGGSIHSSEQRCLC